METSARPGIQVGSPLAGVRVLAIEAFVAGPYATVLFADAGAEVIKIEQPGKGEDYRREGPQFPDAPASLRGGYFWRANRGKRSVSLDLHQPEGRDLFFRLVEHADIVWENLKPGSMAKIGIDWAALRQANPRVIYVTASGFGHEDVLPSPYSRRPAFDILGQAMGGLIDINGTADGPPMWSQTATADMYTAILSAFAAMLALRARDRDGRGRRVDLSMYDAMLSINERLVFQYGATGVVPSRGTAGGGAPHGVYATKDGYIVVAVLGQLNWERFCALLDRPDLVADPRFMRALDRAKHASSLDPLVEQWLADKTSVAAVDLLLERGIPASVVQNMRDVYGCPHVAARHMLMPIERPGADPVTVAGNPIKIGGEPEVPAQLPPELGADNERVLGGWLNLDANKLADLRERGII